MVIGLRLVDQAHSRVATEVMASGCSASLLHASQVAPMIASRVSKRRFDSQFARRDCQMVSTGFSSGARGGRNIKLMFLGTTRAPLGHHEGAPGVPARPVEQEHGVKPAAAPCG